MTGALVVAAGFGLLVAPGVLLPSLHIGGRESARVAASTLVAGLALVAGGMLLLAARASVGGAHLGDFSEMCARAVTRVTGRRDVVGLIAGGLTVVVAIRGTAAGLRSHRGTRRTRAEPWLGHHEDHHDYELVVLPTDQVLAFSVPGRKPQVLISHGLLTHLDEGEVEAVIRHEAAHQAARHSRYLSLAVFVEGAFRPLRCVSRSTAVLRSALEEWADGDAFSSSPTLRASLRSALLAVACHLVADKRGRSTGVVRRARGLETGRTNHGVVGVVLRRSPVVFLTAALILLALVWAGGVHHLAAASGYCFE